jgi:hypothetical protein
MDSTIILGTIIGILLLVQGCINIQFNHYIVTLRDHVETLEQLHWARTNPIRAIEAIEDPECANPSNI